MLLIVGSFDALAVQDVIKDTQAAFVSAGGHEASLANLQKSHALEEADLEKLLAAAEEKLADAKRRIQEFYHNKDTLDDL